MANLINQPVNQMEGLHRLNRRDRLKRVQEIAELSNEEMAILSGEAHVNPEIAEHMIENAIGYFALPLGVASNFLIDGKEILIPMAVEETSIIAAASASAKWIRKEGSLSTELKGRLIIGQIQFPSVKNPERLKRLIQERRNDLLAEANAVVPSLVQRGGGVQAIELRDLGSTDDHSNMLVLHVLCDPCDAMGANLINQICEKLKPKIEEWTQERVGLCILSNLVDTKLVSARVVIRDVPENLAVGIQNATEFARLDPYRAATHNKGILNGIDPILIATGNDWRAVEAGVHAYASRSGSYQPVSSWVFEGGELIGDIEIPLALGVVGGMTWIHPMARIALKILQVKSSGDLARICAAVGLVQNLAALKALSTVGIVKGHMQLHASNLAIAAGAQVHEISAVRERLTQILKVEKSINLTRAKEVLEAIRVVT